MEKYKFWSIYGKPDMKSEDREWFCIPPNKKYIPKWYPKNALIKKHEEKLLPPPSYWLEMEFEDIVYNSAKEDQEYHLENGEVYKP